jgi:hypothetical protein
MSRSLAGPADERSAANLAGSRPAGQLFAASARAVCRSTVSTSLAAVALLVASSPVLASYGSQVLIAVGIILAFALVAAVDDPAGPVLAASPYSLTRRCLYRLAAAGAVAAPVWLVAAVAVAWRAELSAIPTLALQTLALWIVGVGIALCVWRVSASVAPSYVAAPVLVCLTLALDALPRGWQLFNAQSWGPPWVAAQLRWIAVLVFAVSVTGLLLRDAMDQRPRSSANRFG